MNKEKQQEVPFLILAVDEREDNLFVIRRSIKERLPHAEIMTANRPEEGLDMAMEYLPDGILLDIQMPGMSGIEMCRRLKADPRTARIPVILITPHQATPRLKVEGLEAGADDFLAKPIDHAELAVKIKIVLRIKHTEDRLREANLNLERLVAERTAALDESEENFRLLFDTMAQGVVFRDTNGRIIIANPAAERILGLTLDQMMARTSVDPRWKSIHEDGSHFPGDTHPSMTTLETGEKVHNVVMGVFHPKKREYTWMNINTVPLFREGEEKPYLVYTTFDDITERKQAEEALQKAKEELEMRVEERTKELKESEEKFKTLSEKSMVGIFIFQDETFKYINPAFAQIFAYPLHELVKKKFDDIVFPKDRRVFKKKIDKLLKGEIDYSLSQFKGLRKNGDTRHLEVYKAGIVLENKPAIIGTLIDITQRTRFEHDLKEKTGQLEELNRELENRIKVELEKRSRQERLLMQQSKLAAMGEMVGAIAHQWRQPLTTVGVLIQNLNLAHKLNKLNGHMLEDTAKDAMEQVNYMSKTIDDFRDFFRPSKEKETFSVGKAVKETISLMRAQLENNFIKVHFQGEKTAALQASGYPNEFKQVLVNIFNNARNAIIDHRQKKLIGKEEGDIFIDFARTDGEISITIANNGGKIPGNNLNRVFEPYFTTRQESKGTGIGLYMGKIIIEDQMGGLISVKNIEDGVAFTIQLKI
jgi:PAS domain S-box-containing protein